MFEKKAKTKAPVNDLVARRWSGRAYDAKRQVHPEKILSLLEAARWAPSCYGDEPWRFIVCDKFQDEHDWNKAFACLSEGNQSWAKNAPLLLLAVADTILSKNGNPNRWGEYDTGAASMSLCLQATELGLMVHQMGGYDQDKARLTFSIPEQFTPMAMMAVGYQLPVAEIPADMQERELSPRARSDLGSRFYIGHWDIPISSDT